MYSDELYAIPMKMKSNLSRVLCGILAILLTLLDGSAACVNVAQSSSFVLVQGIRHSYSSTDCYSIPLEYIPDYLNDSMILRFNTSELTLTTLLSIEGKKNISVLGLSGGTKISCFPPDISSTGAGLAFIAVQNLTLANLTFEKCGALHNNSVIRFQCSIYILNCSDISIANLVVKNSSGTVWHFSIHLEL